MDRDRNGNGHGEITLQELDARALRVALRVGEMQSPLVGIPMCAGAPPFVTRRKFLEGQTKGIRNLRVRFEFGERTVLRIEGEFGRTGKHLARLPNLCTREGYQSARWVHREWAQKLRDARDAGRKCGKPSEAPGDGIANPELVSKQQARLETKISKIDAEIQRIEKRIKKLDTQRPVNPLIGRRETWGRNASDFATEHAARYYAEKITRKLVSRLAAKYLAQRTAKVEGRKKWSPVAVHFPWKEFYAELAEWGISAPYPYAKMHGRENGPATPEEYLRNPRSFSLIKNKRDAYIYGVGDWAEAMQRHAQARRECIDEMKERASLMSIIEGLQVQREDYQEQVAAIRAAEQQSWETQARFEKHLAGSSTGDAAE